MDIFDQPISNTSFITHLGEKITGERVKEAFIAVANDWRELTKNILSDDNYASHVTHEQKLDNYNRGMKLADKIESGDITSMTIWQRVNEKLTGECVALLPKTKK